MPVAGLSSFLSLRDPPHHEADSRVKGHTLPRVGHASEVPRRETGLESRPSDTRTTVRQCSGHTNLQPNGTVGNFWSSCSHQLRHFTVLIYTSERAHTHTYMHTGLSRSGLCCAVFCYYTLTITRSPFRHWLLGWLALILCETMPTRIRNLRCNVTTAFFAPF